MKINKFNGDVERIRPIALRWKEEYNKSLGIEIEDDVYMAKLQDFADSPDSILLVLVDDDIVGYMGLSVFASPIGNQLICNEHYWFVVPEKRGMSALKFFPVAEKWAKGKGCSHLMMNASNLVGDLHDRTCKLYEKLGMEKFETTFIKRVR